MRWVLIWMGSVACGAGEGSPCRDVDGEGCVPPLDCVQTVPSCTVGPCPGICRAPCGDDRDCAAGTACLAPVDRPDDAPHCTPTSSGDGSDAVR